MNLFEVINDYKQKRKMENYDILQQEKEVVPSGVRLIVLLQGHLREILRREREGRSLIHVYCTGDYWVAFERSGYGLLRLFPDAESTPMRLECYPFPLVVVSVTAAELRAYARRHLFERRGDDYGCLAMPANAQIGYRIWHRQETRGL